MMLHHRTKLSRLLFLIAVKVKWACKDFACERGRERKKEREREMKRVRQRGGGREEVGRKIIIWGNELEFFHSLA